MPSHSPPRPRSAFLIVRARCRNAALSGLLFASALLLPSCSGRHSVADQAGKPIQECEGFLSAYEHCLDTLGPARIAQARIEQTRAAFATQAVQGEPARDALRKQCVARLSQLKTTCR